MAALVRANRVVHALVAQGLLAQRARAPQAHLVAVADDGKLVVVAARLGAAKLRGAQLVTHSKAADPHPGACCRRPTPALPRPYPRPMRLRAHQ